MTRVLAVEDSPTQANQLALTLRAEGFEVEIATDGTEGLARCIAEPFDVVLSDIVMPGLSGYDLCRAIKDNPRTRDVPVILLTTLNEPMAIIDALACGAENFVTKPYEGQYLIGRINDVLANKRTRSERRLTTETEVAFLGKRFTINSDKEQILNLLVSTFEDIVRTNRGLEASQAALRVAERQLQAHSAELARSNKELEAFVYTVSHDLKEPLRGIEAFSRILNDEHRSALVDDAKRYLDIISDSAGRMRQLIDDLLAFSRVGRVQSRPQPVDVVQIVHEVIATLQFAIAEAGAAVEVAPGAAAVMGHAVMVRELLANLLGNALKYRRRDRAPRIEIACHTPERGRVDVTVADNGIGIPAEHRERVFGLFQRLHGRDEYPGTGVGLAFCKRIVEQHGGTIVLDDTPGGGCTVRAQLVDVDEENDVAIPPMEIA
jgi:two-component system, sensor histidine kinase and response regulator